MNETPAATQSGARDAPAERGDARSDRNRSANLDALLGAHGGQPRWRGVTPWLALAAALLAGAALWQLRGSRAVGPQYVTEPVTRGDLTVTVVSNGTLQPTRAVNVGSELSGTVAKVHADINDRVKKGQVLVELDTTKLEAQITRSRATLASNEAKVAQAVATAKEARGNLARMEEVARLSGGKVPSATELDTARAAVDRAVADEAAARAAVADAKAALSGNETDLRKASIRSPIDGVVLARTVDPGNAVAATLQAVTLFTIAEDLSRMKLQVNVDEADVGQVKEGQAAAFTVSAWPNRRYPATTTRVGYGSTIKDNVVTYVTDLEVRNEDLTLRPGMTATATIAAVERKDVLLVPNAALRFSPAAAVGDGAVTPAAGASSGVVSRLIPRPPTGAPRKQAGSSETAVGSGGAPRELWLLRDGQPVAVAVSTGLSNGRHTEVTGPLQAGEQVIVDQRAAAK